MLSVSATTAFSVARIAVGTILQLIIHVPVAGIANRIPHEVVSEVDGLPLVVQMLDQHRKGSNFEFTQFSKRVLARFKTFPILLGILRIAGRLHFLAIGTIDFHSGVDYRLVARLPLHDDQLFNQCTDFRLLFGSYGDGNEWCLLTVCPPPCSEELKQAGSFPPGPRQSPSKRRRQ